MAKTLAELVAAASFIIAMAACWNPDGRVSAVYDSQVVEFNCSLVRDDRAAMHDVIVSITDSLITGTQPGPRGAYACAASNRGDDQPDVWAMAYCAERITKKDCEDCLSDAQNGLMNYECQYMAGGHVWRTDCFLRYEIYEICLTN